METTHLVLGSDMTGNWPANAERIYLGMGCFWGAERKLWAIPGVVTTACGYMGGHTENPLYPEVKTSTTGHAETVLVVYDPAVVDLYSVLQVFWENHDPTQGERQGGDIGSQYRSAVFWTTPEQEVVVRATREAYNKVLVDLGFDPITTQMESAEGKTFWYAEDYHQQYLVKNPDGYDCHAHTGINLPAREEIFA